MVVGTAVFPPFAAMVRLYQYLRIEKTILPLLPFLTGGVIAPHRRLVYDITLPLYTPDTFLR
jgi:hypothetical protein